MWLKENRIRKVLQRHGKNKEPTRLYLGITYNPDQTSIKYRPSHLIQGQEKRRPMTSEFDKSKFTIIKNIQSADELPTNEAGDFDV
jgi:hypothetical protein